MSRVGKKAVPVPQGVTAKVEGQRVSVKGPKGELFFVVHDDVSVEFANDEIKVDPRFRNKARSSPLGNVTCDDQQHRDGGQCRVPEAA